jgi:hypothetical protein
LVPKGAALNGRIVQLQRVYAPVSEWLIVGLKLETIEVNGLPQRFYATLESAFRRRKRWPPEDQWEPMLHPDDPSVGVLGFEDVTEHYVINRGVEIAGRTMAPK